LLWFPLGFKLLHPVTLLYLFYSYDYMIYAQVYPCALVHVALLS